MTRRRFVKAALAAALTGMLAPQALAAPARRKVVVKAASRKKPGKPAKPAPAPAKKSAPVVEAAEPHEAVIPWRNYELSTSVTLPAGKASVRLWLPLPLQPDSAWQREVEHLWTGNADRSGILSDADGEIRFFFAEWTERNKAPQFQLASRIATRDRQFDITRRNPIPERSEILRRYLRATPQIPTDGPVRSTAEQILGRIKDPVAQGKALYDWVAERTRFDSKAHGTGRGDIMALIERPDTPGRCADINGLFVALARSIGLPARLSFGLRIDQSNIIASLGQRGDLAAAQHCRAEFYAAGYGWIPVDPADVRKALAEDSSTLDGMKGTVLRKLLFGFWEPNWIAWNRGREVVLRYALGPPLTVFAGPYVEIDGAPAAVDAGLKIAITSRRGEDLAG